MVLILYNFPSVSLPFRAYVVPLWLLFPLCCLLLLPSGSFFLPSVLPLRGNETPFVPFRGVGSSLRPRSLPPLVRFAVPPLVLRLSPPGKEANQRGNVKDGATKGFSSSPEGRQAVCNNNFVVVPLRGQRRASLCCCPEGKDNVVVFALPLRGNRGQQLCSPPGKGPKGATFPLWFCPKGATYRTT